MYAMTWGSEKCLIALSTLCQELVLFITIFQINTERCVYCDRHTYIRENILGNL